LGQVWQNVNAPVFVIYGTSDTIMSRADAQAISETVNHIHPGHASYWEVDGMDHLLTVNGKFHKDLVPTILQWIKKQLGTM